MRSTIACRISILVLALVVLLPTSYLAAPGDLDPTFGLGGKLTDASGYGAYDVAIQPDGKIVAVGLALGGSQVTQIAVARYNIDGSPDTTFGGTGRVFINHYQVAVDVAIQPDGKIVLASRDPDGERSGELVRLNSNGSLDTSFGTNGIVAGLFMPSISAIQPDGKLLLYQGARLCRFNQDGSSDATFGNACGTPGLSYHYPEHRTPGVVQPDGKILTAFTKVELEGFDPVYIDLGVYRCNPNGTLDTTFGSGGSVITSIGSGRDDEDVAHSIAIQTDGKIVVTGQSRTIADPVWEVTVVRYNSNGSLDTAFGAGGIVTTPTGMSFWLSPQGAVAIQPDGKIVVSTTIEKESNRDFALVRYDPNGSLDTTFGNGSGITTADFNQIINENANGMTLDSQGRAVVVGTSRGFALARFLLNAPLVSVSGRVTTSIGSGLRGQVTITDSQSVRRTIRTDALGNYQFVDVSAGATYTVSVFSRRFTFTSQQVFVNDNLTNINFVGTQLRSLPEGIER